MDWLDIIGDIFKFLFLCAVTFLVLFLITFFVAISLDTNKKVTQIYEMVVPQDTITNETPDEINVTFGFDE
jgi:cell division protein FtsL